MKTPHQVDKKEGWMELDQLIKSVSKSLMEANSSMLKLGDGEKSAFCIKDAKVEISFEFHNTENSDGPKVRLPFVGRRIDENFNESDLCKITYNLGRVLLGKDSDNDDSDDD